MLHGWGPRSAKRSLRSARPNLSTIVDHSFAECGKRTGNFVWRSYLSHQLPRPLQLSAYDPIDGIAPGAGQILRRSRAPVSLLEAVGFAHGNEWHEGGSHGIEMLAPSGGLELIAAPDAPSADAMVEVSDADLAYQIVKKLAPTLSATAADMGGAPRDGVTIRKEIGDTPYGARLFEVEVSGLRLGFLTYAKKTEAQGMGAELNATGKHFAIVVARFNSFITERLLDGALLALRQCGADPASINIVRVPGSFGIPAAGRQLAQSKSYHAIICLGCLLRADRALRRDRQ